MEAQTEIEFVESLGLIMQADGFPRIAGRLLGVFVARGGPLNFAELSELLEVSRASISTNTRLLEELGAIERVAMKGERQDYFRLAENPYQRICERKIDRAARASEAIRRAGDALADDGTGAQERIGDLAGFFMAISTACSRALEEMQADAAAKRPAPRVVAGE